MRILILTLLLFAFVSADAQTAQVWVKVASEGDSVTATATVRYGSGASWKQLSVSGPIKANNATFGDPIPGTVKELDVLETATPQQITVNGKAVTVPAKSASYVITCTTPPLPTPLPATTTANCTVVKQ